MPHVDHGRSLCRICRKYSKCSIYSICRDCRKCSTSISYIIYYIYSLYIIYIIFYHIANLCIYRTVILLSFPSVSNSLNSLIRVGNSRNYLINLLLKPILLLTLLHCVSYLIGINHSQRLPDFIHKLICGRIPG